MRDHGVDEAHDSPIHRAPPVQNGVLIGYAAIMVGWVSIDKLERGGE